MDKGEEGCSGPTRGKGIWRTLIFVTNEHISMTMVTLSYKRERITWLHLTFTQNVNLFVFQLYHITLLQSVNSTADVPSASQSLLQTLWTPLTPCSDSTVQLHGKLLACLIHCLTSPTNNTNSIKATVVALMMAKIKTPMPHVVHLTHLHLHQVQQQLTSSICDCDWVRLNVPPNTL